ncbi:MAG: hypothetical protein P0Y53_00525 [Candidatus Pseudobacter hemicellulosilyticus]|uniref:Uncharacterized protein n=1 Tax=Candidatus Pseudobacter hemicellulosilyticus TaxID=3121375 RepID=A0AAJ5WTP2_9BACT|nr:MAG: hypothetical protein P0Y53_00525 [Pseudobacter sp.]
MATSKMKKRKEAAILRAWFKLTDLLQILAKVAKKCTRKNDMAQQFFFALKQNDVYLSTKLVD